MMNRLLGGMMQQMLEMAGMKKRRNNRNIMLSIVGLGLGAAAVSMMRGRNMNNIMEPVKDAIGDMRMDRPIG